jgi:hypothetical protein
MEEQNCITIDATLNHCPVWLNGGLGGRYKSIEVEERTMQAATAYFYIIDMLSKSGEKLTCI